jgi:anti-sigma factor RsiW
MSSCDEQLLGAYFDGELSSEDRARFEEHLQQCPACARELERLGEASRLLREYPFEDLSDRERMRLHEAVEAAADRPIWRIGASLGLIAASILIVGLAWLNALSPTATPNRITVLAPSPSDPWERVAMTLRSDWAPTQAEEQIQLADNMVAGLSAGVVP